MPARPAHSREKSALSTLIGTSMFLASPGTSDESASRPPPNLISRSEVSLPHAQENGAASPKASPLTTEALLKAIFAKAGKLYQGDLERSPLAKNFKNAGVMLMVATCVALVMTGVVWKLTAWAYPHSNAVPTALLCFVATLYLVQKHVFRWLLHESETSFQARVWGMTAAFLERPENAQTEAEAAHWLNDILDSIWPFLNPDIFKSLTDVMEATIQANSPPFVSAVSIEDMGQGARPLRLVGIRRLPKQPMDEDEGPTSGEMFDDILKQRPGMRTRTTTDLSSSTKRSAYRELRERLKMLRERTSVHMEVAFDYGCTEADERNGKRMHILLVFRLVGGIRVPVWVNMQKIVGSLRARVQLKPDPPFVSTAVVSFMGKPEVQFACLPLFRSSLNVMGMPLVSDLVRQALDAALAAYISPRSITIDVGAILVGDTTAKDVYPLGVILLKIHRVYDIHSKWADDGLSSFISVGWGKTQDPLYIYRTIYDSVTPRWEEEMVYCVGPDEVNAQETLEIDFSRVGSLDNEDSIAKLELPINNILSTPECTGKMQRRTETIICSEDQHQTARLEYSIGFFPKATVSLEQLQRQTIYPPIKSHEEFEHRVEQHVRYKFREAPDYAEEEYEREKNAAMREAELKIMNSQPPVEKYPSGILYYELPSMSLLSASRAGRETDESDEIIYDDETPDAPTSYANIYINQHRVTRTVMKPRNSDPAYGSWDFRFVGDWRTAELIVVIRDKRRHKSDTFLGAVRINVAELFERHQSSRVELSLPIEGGHGSGMANMTVLFRAVDIQLPPALRGWHYGTLQMHLPITDHDGTLQDLKHGHLMACTELEQLKLYPNHSYNPLTKDPHNLEWMPKDKHKASLTFPIKNKYSERLFLAWISKLPWKMDRISAYAFLKLEDFVEHEETKLVVPVYAFQGKEKDLEQQLDLLWPDTHEGKEPIGHVGLEVVFKRGLTREHAREMKSRDVDDVMDVVEALGPNPHLGVKTT